MEVIESFERGEVSRPPPFAVLVRLFLVRNVPTPSYFLDEANLKNPIHRHPQISNLSPSILSHPQEGME